MKCRVKSTPKANMGLQIEGNQFTPLSDKSILLNGKSHTQGGVDLQFGGSVVEAEKDEVLFKDEDGLVVMGNMEIPGSKKKFKTAAKELGKQEAKASKLQTKASSLIGGANPFNPYSSLKYNAGRVMQDAAIQKDLSIQEQKQELADLQQFMLNLADSTGESPEKISSTFKNGGKLKAKYKDGGKIDYRDAITKAAIAKGVDHQFILNMVGVESSYNTQAVSPKNAQGLMQFMPATAKDYGISEKELTSKDPKVQEKVINAGVEHFAKLLSNYKGDYTLALAAYNGGPGAVNYVQKQLGKKSITGEDWLGFMQQKRKTDPSKDPSAWQNETYNHIKKIQGKGEESVFAPSVNYIGQNTLRPDFTTGEEAVITDSLPQEYSPYMQTRQPQPMSTTRDFTPAQASREQLERAQYQQRNIDSAPTRNRGMSATEMNKLQPYDFATEIPAILDRADYVQGQRYEPTLYQPFQVSFQDRLNQNSSTFRQTAQQLPNNPQALSVLAAQKYNADNQVLGEQFRTNQQIANEVTNQNTGLLNQAALQNIQLQDQQYMRQEQAKAVTQARRDQALASVSNKFGKNRQVNTNIRLAESLSDYRFDEQGNLIYAGDPTYITANSANANVPSDYYKGLYRQRQGQEIMQQASQAPAKKWGGYLKKK